MKIKMLQNVVMSGFPALNEGKEYHISDDLGKTLIQRNVAVEVVHTQQELKERKEKEEEKEEKKKEIKK